MKTVISTIVFNLTFVLAAYTQNETVADDRLLVKYSIEELSQMEKENPEQLEYLNFCLEYAFYLTPYPEKKRLDLEVIEVENSGKINFFALNIDIDETAIRYFRIAGTNQMLVVRSKALIQQKLKESK